MTYYDRDGIVVRDSNDDDALYIGLNMREADKKEIWASHNHRPLEAMKLSLDESFMCLTVLDRKVPVLMFGIVPRSLLGETATIWMLATDGINNIKRRFVRHSRSFIKIFLGYFPILENYVYEENIKSIEWLMMCGAKIEEAMPFGIEQKLFRRFTFTRN